jgi:hypothetical protein
MADANSLSSGTPDLDELVAFIGTVVRDWSQKSGRPTHGAALADAVRRKFPDISYAQLGIEKLSDAVARAEAQNLVVRNRSVKHLEVLPALPEPVPGSAREDVAESAQHLREDVWRAFAFVGREAGGVFDRETGQVLPAAPNGESEPERFVAIRSIALPIQQEWMREFLRKKQIDSATAPIDSQFCFRDFPVWLRGIDPALEREWKRIRVQRVISQVRAWALESSVPLAPLLGGTRSKEQSLQRVKTPNGERWLREALIAAANELPIEELEAIAIPLRFVRHALQSR